MSEQEFFDNLIKLVSELKEYYESKGLSSKLVDSLPNNQKKILGDAFYCEKRMGWSITKKQAKLIEALKEANK